MSVRTILFAIGLCGLFGLCGSTTAVAQTPITATIVSSCGALSLNVGVPSGLTMDATGVLCTSSSGGGGGSVTQGTSPWVVGQSTAASLKAQVSTASGGIASGSVASGAFASGSIASGAIASGAAVSGAFADGAVVTMGTEADAAWTSGSGTLIAIAKGIYTAVIAPLAAQSSHGINIGAVEGLVASGATAGTYPVLQGGLAENVEATAVTNGQAVRGARDLVGRDITFPYANKENLVEGSVTLTATTSPVSMVASGGTGNYIYITALSCFNSGSTATVIELENGSGGSVFWTGYALNGGGGFTISFPSPIGGPALSTATAVYALSLSSTSSVYCNASGFKGT